MTSFRKRKLCPDASSEGRESATMSDHDFVVSASQQKNIDTMNTLLPNDHNKKVTCYSSIFGLYAMTQSRNFMRYRKTTTALLSLGGVAHLLWISIYLSTNYDVLFSPLIIHSRTLSSYHKQKPRIIAVKDQNNLAQTHLVYDSTPKTSRFKISRRWETNAHIDHGLEDFEEGDCKAMHNWQLETYPSCNNVHEYDFSQYSYITSGGWRDVWKGYEYNGQPYVIKTLVFDGTEFRYRDSERHRRDAITYSLLQGSSHVMNIYDYCVNTASFDFVEGGTLQDMLENKMTLKWSSEEKLRYSWQLAKGLADLHSVGSFYGSAAIAHTDISPDQFLWFDGMFKV
jgi:Protein tyrosine kinase.